MNINATLILQSIAMMIFVWFCMKFIWPPLLKALDERRERIAEGLAASDKAEKELEAAKLTVEEQIREARDKAALYEYNFETREFVRVTDRLRGLSQWSQCNQ